MNKLYRLLEGIILLFTTLFQPTDLAGKCGTTLHTISPVRSISPSDRIVGGVDVGYYKYPWYVALMHEGEIYCGGTLISNRYVVSAAHCYEEYFEQASAGKIKLENVLTPIFGAYNICDTKEATQKRNKISKVFIHEKYNKDGNYFDISLLRLKKKAKGFEPCCMPTHVYTSDTRPKEGYITGLGDQVFHDKNATCTLREARLLIQSDDACKKMLDDSGEKGSELNGAFCAGYLEGGIDACQGDSGGPLMVLGNNSKFMLLGIVSFGEDCAKPKRFGVYTDASKYLDWIYNKMKKPKPTDPSQESTVSTSPTTSVTTGTASPVTPVVTPAVNHTTSSPEQSTSQYHPSTYVFPIDLDTTMASSKGPQSQYNHNRPIIIIINKKGMKRNGTTTKTNKKEN